MSWDPAEYQRKVLRQAVEDFTRSQRLPDVFTRYDLPLDTDQIDRITARIDQVLVLWNRLKQNKKYRYLMEALLAPRELEQARAVLLDPARRAAEAAAVRARRREERDAIYNELEESIALVAAKGYYTPPELQRLVRLFGPRGISEEEIRKHLLVPEGEPRAVLPTEEGLPRAVRNQIRSNLSVLGLTDLYGFLGLSGPVPAEEVSPRYEEVRRHWLAQPPDFQRAAAQELLGLVKAHLVEGDPALYEQARQWDRVEQLEPRVELASADRRITRDEYEALLDFAGRLGWESEAAREIILALAEKHQAHVEWTTLDLVRCGNCWSTFARAEGLERCTNCGQALTFPCPRCGRSVGTEDNACGGCGFRMADLLRAREWIAAAERALESGDLAVALENAERVRGLDLDTVELQQRLEARMAALEQFRERLELSMAGSRLLEARRVLQELLLLAPGYVGVDGVAIQGLRERLERQYQRLQELATRAAVLRAERPEEAAAVYQQILTLAVDAESAREALARLAPEPVRRLRALPDRQRVVLEWQPSPSMGQLVYRVERNGELLARTGAPRWVDEAPPWGKVLNYTVTTERGEGFSDPARADPVAVAREVENLALVPGDGEIRGSWVPPEGGWRIRVFRDGLELPAGPRSFCDAGLVNDQPYTYRIAVDTEAGLTPGRTATVRPQQLPPVVELLGCVPDASGLRLQAPELARGVLEVYPREACPFAPGTLLWGDRLQELGVPLKAGHDPAPRAGENVYVPVTHVGTVAMVGTPFRHFHVPEIRELEARDLGSYLLLTWLWPEGCPTARVRWHAADPSSAQAEVRDVTRAAYELEGGFRLPSPGDRPYHFAVHALVDRVASQHAARAAVRQQPPVEVSYQVSRGKLFRSRAVLKLRAETEVADLPELVLIGRRGDLSPLHQEDGTVLARFQGVRLEPRKELELPFALDSLRPPLTLRAFLGDADPRFRLLDPPPRQLRWQ